MVAVRHLWFWKFAVFLIWPLSACRSTSWCKISLKSDNRLISYGQKQRFSRWRPPPSWILKISIFGHVTVIRFNICCNVQNFIKIARFFTEIWWFSDLQNGVRPPSWICYDVTILPRRIHFPCPNIGLKFHVDRCCSFRDTCSIISQPFGCTVHNGPWQFWGYACTVSRLGVQDNHSYETFDPYLHIRYATFMRKTCC